MSGFQLLQKQMENDADERREYPKPSNCFLYISKPKPEKVHTQVQNLQWNMRIANLSQLNSCFSGGFWQVNQSPIPIPIPI